MDPISLGLLFGSVALIGSNLKAGVKVKYPEPSGPLSNVEDQVVARIRDASLITVPDQSTWSTVELNGQKWLVAPYYLAPVGIGEAQMIADKYQLSLPTPALVDAIWKAADLKLDPLPRGPTSKPPSDYTARTMNSLETNIDQLARISKQVQDTNPNFQLLAGTHKDVVMGVPTTGTDKTPKIGIYGWHQKNGKPIQGFMWGHALEWKDYSQGLRLVKQVT